MDAIPAIPTEVIITRCRSSGEGLVDAHSIVSLHTRRPHPASFTRSEAVQLRAISAPTGSLPSLDLVSTHLANFLGAADAIDCCSFSKMSAVFAAIIAFVFIDGADLDCLKGASGNSKSQQSHLSQKLQLDL